MKRIVKKNKRKGAIFLLLVGFFTLSGFLIIESDAIVQFTCITCSNDERAMRVCDRICWRKGGCTHMDIEEAACLDDICTYTWELGCETGYKTLFGGSKFCPECTHGGRN